MNERKQQVIKSAQQLFIEKGYQATSIQDILNYSCISRGTFYNYFPSKSELLKAIFISIRENMEISTNELLIGHSRADTEVFIKQIVQRMEINKKNMMFTLIEEVFVSIEEDLKQFIKTFQLLDLHWVHRRFVDIFGENHKPYLLDGALMFSGMLKQTFHFKHMISQGSIDVRQIIRYHFDRINGMINDMSISKSQLIDPEVLDNWISTYTSSTDNSYTQLLDAHKALTTKISTSITSETKKKDYIQLVQFIKEEIMEEKQPRPFLINSTLGTLKQFNELQDTDELGKFERSVNFFL